MASSIQWTELMRRDIYRLPTITSCVDETKTNSAPVDRDIDIGTLVENERHPIFVKMSVVERVFQQSQQSREADRPTEVDDEFDEA